MNRTCDTAHPVNELFETEIDSIDGNLEVEPALIRFLSTALYRFKFDPSISHTKVSLGQLEQQEAS